MDLTPSTSLGHLLDDKLAELLQRLESCEAQLRRSETALGAKGEELDKLKELLTGKISELQAQIEDLAQALRRKADLSDTATLFQLEAVKKILELKANRNEVPQKETVVELQESTLSNSKSLEEVQTTLSAAKSRFSQQINELQQSVHTKAEQCLVPSLELFQLRLAEKADVTAVPTNEQLKVVMKILQMKADAEQVPRLSDFQALGQSVLELGGLKAQLEALQALVLQKESELQNLQRIVQHKADVGEVATSLEVQLLNGKLEGKAEAKDTPTLLQFQALSKTMENKADSWDVPTLAEFRAMDHLLRKHGDLAGSVEELQKLLQQVVTKQCFEKLMKEVSEKADSKDVPNMEEFDTLKEALDLKANRSDVPTLQNFVALQKDMPSRAAIMVLNNALQGKANANTVATKEELQALVGLLNGKADVTSVPNWKDFHHLRDRVQRKADRESVPSLTQFQLLNTALAKVSEGQGESSLKRRRSPECRTESPGCGTPLPQRLCPGTPRPRVATPCPGTPKPAEQTPCPGTPRPKVAKKSPPTEARDADAPALTPFGRKVATPARAKTQEVATPRAKTREVATPARAKTQEAEIYPRPHKRTPVVKAGKKKGQKMIWSKTLGVWQEP
ncbi:unnamed protein product [Durusdinium trenchii]|uniref:Uncharacterized protein n=1 Tax=Durusdinium trenchii TaxID=1381693 RepID=A0ABP0N3Z8_9DINO